MCGSREGFGRPPPPLAKFNFLEFTSHNYQNMPQTPTPLLSGKLKQPSDPRGKNSEFVHAEYI